MAKKRPAESQPETLGEINFQVDEKLPGVFGDYSSLGIVIGLRFPGNVDEFEAEIDKYLERAVTKVQKTMNEIAAGSGFPNPWKE